MPVPASEEVKEESQSRQGCQDTGKSAEYGNAETHMNKVDANVSAIQTWYQDSC